MSGPSVRVSAYYSAPVDRFLTTEPHHVLGALASAHSHDLDVEQRQAWEEELLILKAALTALTGTLFLEFDVPRLGSRIDTVLISGPAVFPKSSSAVKAITAWPITTRPGTTRWT